MDSGLFLRTHLYLTKKKKTKPRREKEEKQKGVVTHSARHIFLSFLFSLYTQGSTKDSGRHTTTVVCTW